MFYMTRNFPIIFLQNQYFRNQQVLVYFYMGLFGGNLVLTLHDNNFATLEPFMSRNLTISDGKWHTVTLVYLASRLVPHLVFKNDVEIGWNHSRCLSENQVIVLVEILKVLSHHNVTLHADHAF